MIETYSVTQVIAALIGLYMVAGGIGLLTERDLYSEVIRGIKANVALAYVAAVIAFAVGAAIVAVHNRWGTPLEVVVSLVGWIAVLEGVLLIAARRSFIRVMAALPLTSAVVRVIAIVLLAAGVILLYAGLV